MKYTVGIGIGVVVIVAAVVFAFSTRPNRSGDVVLAPTQSATAEVSPTTESADVRVAATGTYQDYSESTFSQSQVSQRLLFFHAPWCPQCRALEASIRSSAIPENTAIFKVDFDTSQQLRQRYGVTQQTTVVRVDSEGALVKKVVAYDTPTLAWVLGELR